MARQKAHKVLELPQPTEHCEVSPIIEYATGNLGPDEVRVRYDAEADNPLTGDIETPAPGPLYIWTTVLFSGAMAMQFTPEISITKIMVEGYNCVAEVENSEWLATLRERAERGFLKIQDSKRHFLIFFDHYGCLEVIADSVCVVDDEDSKPVPDR